MLWACRRIENPALHLVFADVSPGLTARLARVDRPRKNRKIESAVRRVLFPASAGEAGAPWGGSHPSRSPVTRRLQRPYPRTGRASRIVLLFGLAPGGVYRASRSPGCWWALTHTISPSPSLARRL